jgi:hypothetical protein
LRSVLSQCRRSEKKRACRLLKRGPGAQEVLLVLVARLLDLHVEELQIALGVLPEVRHGVWIGRRVGGLEQADGIGTAW